MAAAGLFVFAAGSFVVGFFDPSTEKFFPPCPLFSLTGFACSGCGLTRGFHALFHGDIFAALDFNALVPIYAFAFLYLIILLCVIAFKGKGLKFQIFTPKILWSFLFISIVFGIIRNIPAYPFSILYP